jgi:PIN domain nuclease of toxin-antitoxin system
LSVALVLDTCALLDLDNGLFPLPVVARIEAARRLRQAHVLATVAVEVAQKVWAGKLALDAEPAAWFARVVEEYGLLRAPLTDAVAFAAYSLPEPFHRDPADRMIVAFGRLTGRHVVTSDRKIIDYARAGHVDAVPY